MLAEDLKQRAHKLEKIKNEAQALADKLAEVALTIPTKVSATGVIYWIGKQFADCRRVEEAWFDIDRKIIVVKDVKEVGSYHATVKLHKEVSVEIPFEVVAEEA
mgnify:CR=1 FL=1